MGDPIKGFRVSASFTIGNKGLSLNNLSLTPGAPVMSTLAAPTKDSDWVVRPDQGSPALRLGLFALGTMSLGAAARALRHDGTPVFNLKEIGLDAAVALPLWCGTVGGPRAESFFTGCTFDLVNEWFNKRKDPRWDVRVGMLTHGVVNVLLDEVGGCPQIWKGYGYDQWGEVDLLGGQLLGNAATEMAYRAFYHSFSNWAAAKLQGFSDPSLLKSFTVRGAWYGAAEGAATSLFLGPQVRVEKSVIDEALKKDASYGGDPDAFKKVLKYTNIRSGGLLFSSGNILGITLPRNVSMQPQELKDPTTYYHEGIHRRQAVGQKSTLLGVDIQGQGSLSWYCNYLKQTGSNTAGYLSSWDELMAWKLANGRTFSAPSYANLTPNGDGAALGTSLLLFGATQRWRGKNLLLPDYNSKSAVNTGEVGQGVVPEQKQTSSSSPTAGSGASGSQTQAPTTSSQGDKKATHDLAPEQPVTGADANKP